MGELLRLGDYCLKIGSGATPRGGKEVYLADGPYSLIRSQNIYNDGFSHNGLAFISDEQARLLSNVEVRLGDVLVNITGDSVARVCQVDPGVLPARVNQHVAIVRPDNGRIDATFLRYWLVSPEMQGRLLALASAGATRNALTKSMLEDLPVASFEVTTQKAIANVLSSLDDKIALNRRMNATLEGMAQALFRDWFVTFGPVRRKLAGATDPVAILGGLIPDPARAALHAAHLPDTLGDDDLPMGWKLRPIGSLAQIKGGKQLTKEEFVDDGPVPVFGGAGHMGQTDKSNADGYVITVGRVGAYCGNFVAQRGKAWVNNNASDIRSNRDVPPEWLFLALKELNIDVIKKGAAQPFISNGDLSNLLTVWPNATGVSAFQGVALPLILRIEANIEENRTLSKTRDYLLPRLMFGKVRVADAEWTAG